MTRSFNLVFSPFVNVFVVNHKSFVDLLMGQFTITLFHKFLQMLFYEISNSEIATMVNYTSDTQQEKNLSW
jgi:hypothetical protein